MINQDLINEANILADEDLDETTMTMFYNQCTADINIRIGASYPSITVNELGNTPLIPEKWARALYIPYIAGKIKQQDSSQFEYGDLYNQFEQALRLFQEKFQIPEQYQDKSDWETDPETGELVPPEDSSIMCKPSYPWIWRW